MYPCFVEKSPGSTWKEACAFSDEEIDLLILSSSKTSLLFFHHGKICPPNQPHHAPPMRQAAETLPQRQPRPQQAHEVPQQGQGPQGARTRHSDGAHGRQAAPAGAVCGGGLEAAARQG